MIPKKLHYVWLGDGEPPEQDRKYIEGWLKVSPGWELRRWGLDDLKGIDSAFVRETIETKRWAFTSDWLRLSVLSNEGGFYLDTDVELKSSLERFCGDSLCMGLNYSGRPQTALIGAEPHHPIIEEMLAEYADKHFILAEGCYDETANTDRFFKLFLRHGVNLEKLSQDRAAEVMPGVKLYPSSLLCRPSGNLENVAHHHKAGTWLTPYKRQAIYELPGGYRVLRLKKRLRMSPDAANQIELLQHERQVAKLSLGRVLLVLVRKCR